MRSLVTLASLLLVLIAARPAAACTAPRCWPGFLVPSDGAAVPANVPALYWRPMVATDGTAGVAEPSNVVLATTADPTTPIPFTASALPNGDYLLIPDAALVPGTYALTDHNTCGGGDAGPSTMTPPATFSVGSAAPLPTSLGNLAARAPQVKPLQVGTSSGSCTTTVQATTVAIDLQPAVETTAWLDALHFETLVDGVPWAYAGVHDVLFRTCSSADPSAAEGLPAGTHEVRMRATLPGSGIVLLTEPISIALQCDDGVGCNAGGPRGYLSLALVGLAGIAGRRRRR